MALLLRLLPLSFLVLLPPTHARTTVVTLSNFVYTPATVTINVSDTVEWKVSGGAHNVIQGEDANGCQTGVALSGGFASPTPMNSGDTYSHTFNASGVYYYFCGQHCSSWNMSGVVVVLESTSAATTTAPPTTTTISSTTTTKPLTTTTSTSASTTTSTTSPSTTTSTSKPTTTTTSTSTSTTSSTSSTSTSTSPSSSSVSTSTTTTSKPPTTSSTTTTPTTTTTTTTTIASTSTSPASTSATTSATTSTTTTSAPTTTTTTTTTTATPTRTTTTTSTPSPTTSTTTPAASTSTSTTSSPSSTSTSTSTSSSSVSTSSTTTTLASATSSPASSSSSSTTTSQSVSTSTSSATTTTSKPPTTSSTTPTTTTASTSPASTSTTTSTTTTATPTTTTSTTTTSRTTITTTTPSPTTSTTSATTSASTSSTTLPGTSTTTTTTSTSSSTSSPSTTTASTTQSTSSTTTTTSPSAPSGHTTKSEGCYLSVLASSPLSAVHTANASDCLNGGWQTFTTSSDASEAWFEIAWLPTAGFQDVNCWTALDFAVSGASDCTVNGTYQLFNVSMSPGTYNPVTTTTTPTTTIAPTTAFRGTVHYVTLSGVSFTPSQLQITAGDIVVWTVVDNQQHSVVQTHGDSCIAIAGGFSSPTLSVGGISSFSQQFPVSTSINYVCTFHCSLGMKAQLNVVAQPLQSALCTATFQYDCAAYQQQQNSLNAQVVAALATALSVSSSVLSVSFNRCGSVVLNIAITAPGAVSLAQILVTSSINVPTLGVPKITVVPQCADGSPAPNGDTTQCDASSSHIDILVVIVAVVVPAVFVSCMSAAMILYYRRKLKVLDDVESIAEPASVASVQLSLAPSMTTTTAITATPRFSLPVGTTTPAGGTTARYCFTS